MSIVYDEKVYANNGNPQLLSLIGVKGERVLDVGCGAGDNAAIIKVTDPGCKLFGITLSRAEAQIAGVFLEQCWIADIERAVPDALRSMEFDVLIFSHVLEHTRDPGSVLASFLPLLRDGGEVLIAVPNVLVWRQRLKFLFGEFEHESEGLMDETHLRFFTFHTADEVLLAKTPGLRLVKKSVSGSVPLSFLRRHVLPSIICNRLDDLGCRAFPNLFDDQVLIKAIKTRANEAR